MNRITLTTVAAAWGMSLAFAQIPSRAADQASDEALIRTSIEAYVAAFNRGDAKALADLWSPEAVYINPISGEQVVGRQAIEEQFSAILSTAKGSKLDVQTVSIQFVSPNVAVEQGIAKVARPEYVAEESDYSAVYVKRDGQWLLDRVTEEDVPVVASNYEQLKDLEWMIGDWVDQDEQNRVKTSCHWTKNKNFITRSFVLEVHDRIEMAGMQIIGWDPAAKQIRSWVFDSDGGFGEGVSRNKDKSWYIQSTGTLADGGKSSSVNIIRYVDDNTFTWQSVNREAGGELLPNVDEVFVVRQPSTE